MEDIKILEKIGLLTNDRKIYLSLLEIGSSTSSNLVKKTGLQRSYIYDILDKLIELGLVSFTIKNNKKYFSAENPEVALKILENKEQSLKEDKEEIKKILPKLIKNQNKAIEKQEARIFTGKEGIKSILEDILKENKNFVAFGAEGNFKDIFKWYFTNWQKRRTKLKIKHKIIYNEKLKKERPSKEQKLIEVKFLPKEYEFPATTIVYKDKVAIVIWNDDPICFVLESNKIRNTFLNYFELLWKIAKK
jgi:sugar-specific transcriptional regulator TrmB